uniref:Uncharacterized protein n=1 Tax=Arundo donax TaxID=35708 RepID=A0A0A8YHX1_ARUDO
MIYGKLDHFHIVHELLYSYIIYILYIDISNRLRAIITNYDLNYFYGK